MAGRPRTRARRERDPYRPQVVTDVAREIFDHTDPERLTRAIERLGWKHVRTNEYSGAWLISDGTYEVLIMFGGPRHQARAHTWREIGGPSERI